MKKINIYIIHGYLASSESNWFPYLKNKLENDVVKVTVFNMPNSKNPKLLEWVNHIKNNITNFDENSILIGHSLGCVAILNYLNNSKPAKFKGLYLIAGFVEKTPIPELLEFVEPLLNYNKIIELTNNRMVIAAKDDDIIHYKYSQFLAEKIDANFTLLNEGKHFIERDNFTKFPLLVKEIKKLIE